MPAMPGKHCQKHSFITLLIVCALTPSMLLCDDWPSWRGPNHDGSSEEKSAPEKFGPEENVKWKASLPGPASCTPIIIGKQVFLTTFDRKTSTVSALALDRENGKTLWSRLLGKGEDDRNQGTENFLAAPSPATNGKLVFFLTGRGDLSSYDLAGKKSWSWNAQERYGDFNCQFGYGSSPLLSNGKLFIQVLHRDSRYKDLEKVGKFTRESYLLAIDPPTGEVLYRHVRKSDAVAESLESYSTPIPRRVGDRTEILVVGGDTLSAHDPATGRELWRHGGWNPEKITHWRMVTSPVTGGGLVYASAPKFGPVIAIDSSGSATKVSWKLERDTTDTPTPLFYRGKLYVLNGRKRVLNCVDPKTGEVLRKSRLPGFRYMRASPTAAAGKIYMINADGEVVVVAAHSDDDERGKDGKPPAFEILNNAKMGGYPARSSISIAYGNLFIRTAEALYCIGK